MLVEMADRMTATVRRADSIASVGVGRAGGARRGSIGRRAQHIAGHIMERVGAPLLGYGRPLVVTVSLGAAMASRWESPDVVIEQAERAMRTARVTGGRDRPSGAGIEPGIGTLRHITGAVGPHTGLDGQPSSVTDSNTL